jgi:hypothetical protein
MSGRISGENHVKGKTARCQQRGLNQFIEDKQIQTFLKNER